MLPITRFAAQATVPIAYLLGWLTFLQLLLVTVLVSPHLTVYDLVILVPAFVLLADWLIAHSNAPPGHAGTLLYLVYALPLLGPFARWTHVQLSVIAMAALLYVIWRIADRESLSGMPETRMAEAKL